MKKNTYLVLVSIAQFLISLQLHADNVITFFIRPYPRANPHEKMQSMVHKFSRPGKIAKYHLKSLQRDAATPGLFCTYAGFLALSNGVGQVTLPLKQDEPKLAIMVANRIQPMLMAANTIHHWELMPDTPAAYYSLERKKDDESNIVYWDTRKAEVPEDGIIPTKSILIFAKPKNIFVPEGVKITDDGPNFVLPTVYARKATDIATNALRALMIRQFFDPVRAERKRDGKMYQMHEVY